MWFKNEDLAFLFKHIHLEINNYCYNTMLFSFLKAHTKMWCCCLICQNIICNNYPETSSERVRKLNSNQKNDVLPKIQKESDAHSCIFYLLASLFCVKLSNIL